MICFVLYAYICIIRYIAFQATIDTIHTTEEVRENARSMERRNHEEHIKRLEVSFLLGNYYSLLFLHGYLQLAFFLFLLFCHYCSILFLFFIFLINYLIPLILCSGMGYLPCLFFIKPSYTFSCYSPSELICRGIGLSLRRSFRSSETMFVF